MNIPLKKDDPAYWMLSDGFITTPMVHDEKCYICTDPEFAQMGLPLCKPCPNCLENNQQDGHIPADDVTCTVCGYDMQEEEGL